LNTDWLPAIEQFGEGLFIHVEPNAISNWLSRPAVQERLEALFAGHAAWASAKFGMRVPEHPGAAYIVLHTLSHALISEIALDCGYPASSLKERVYALAEPGSPQQTTRCGILIYTATAGSLGTLGGLVATTQRFGPILAAALRRLQICSNDPVCADHHPASRADDRALHGAACHGCLLIAETSCEMRNVFLDRALIVDTMGVAGARLL
jgi:MrfA Zn-binding domain